eukprot:CAMPEP_0184692764 /NCGR_PEP_ID=MMETSP0313-20130426/1097_1 /TAXON_ID=2792 /ORGANISM="Porphyridium aerugineum, Strain SAG 1380-2" /LENGTH=589 /DNA_ID=CAMNT_0027150613 /DNA_START=79 /DNA_END=1848 /DNA_ORIENTATION=+
MAFVSIAVLSSHSRLGSASLRPTKGFLTTAKKATKPHRATIRLCASTASKSTSTGLPAAEEKAALLKLQNGSDVRGVALKLKDEHVVNMTAERTAELTRAFAFHVSKLTNKPVKDLKIAVGRDSRLSGDRLTQAAIVGLLDAGVGYVMNCGLCTTPGMFVTTITQGYDCDGAMMLTASHLPPERNGIKFFTKEGGASKKDITNLIEMAATAYEQRSSKYLDLVQHNKSDKVHSVDFLQVYAKILADKIRSGVNHKQHYDTPLKGYKIIVDAGNGAGGFFATQVLKPLGADITGSQFLEPDGTFPNHVPNPEDAAAMDATIQATLDSKADIGIVFDTDVDRSAIVSNTGESINRNKLIALLAAIVIREAKSMGITSKINIVTDSVTSLGLKSFIEKRGGVHFRYKRGYKNVIDKALELNAQGTYTPLAIETSGHGAMKENNMLDDGAYSVVKLLIELVRLAQETGNKYALFDLLDELEHPKDEKECRLSFINDAKEDFKARGEAILKAFLDFGSKQKGWKLEDENYEGYRFIIHQDGGNVGWVLIRPSLHDPLLAMNVESSLQHGVTPILTTLRDFFSPYSSQLDLSSLK